MLSCDIDCVQHKLQRGTVDGFVTIKKIHYDAFSPGSKFLGDDVFRNHFYAWCGGCFGVIYIVR